MMCAAFLFRNVHTVKCRSHFMIDFFSFFLFSTANVIISIEIKSYIEARAKMKCATENNKREKKKNRWKINNIWIYVCDFECVSFFEYELNLRKHWYTFRSAHLWDSGGHAHLINKRAKRLLFSPFCFASLLSRCCFAFCFFFFAFRSSSRSFLCGIFCVRSSFAGEIRVNSVLEISNMKRMKTIVGFFNSAGTRVVLFTRSSEIYDASEWMCVRMLLCRFQFTQI